MTPEKFPRSVGALRHTVETAAQAAERQAVEPRIVVFAIRLPFHLAVEDGSVFALRRSIDSDEPPWVQLTVYRASIPLRESALSPYDTGLATLLGEVEHDPSGGASVQTWVFAETLNVLFADEGIRPGDVDEALVATTLFERSLAAVNQLGAAERLLIGHPWSRFLTKEALDPKIQYFEAGEDGELVPRGSMILHERPYNPVVRVDDPDLGRKVADAIGRRLASDASARPHPLVTGRELERQAGAYRLSGDYTAAVIALQTAAESFLRGVHQLALVDAGRTGAEVDAGSSLPFVTVLKKELPPLLGGDWSSLGSPVTTYLSDLYEIRNRITHAGRTPKWQQMQPAFDAYEALVAFIEKQVRNRSRRLSRTLAALWEPWAGGHLALPRSAETRVQELLREPALYWLPADEAGR